MNDTTGRFPTFSVIMPCYNSQAYVRSALDSVIDQTWPNWELILVNDGSKDDTLTILQEYAKKDSRIKVYSKENGGYVSAVNHGLEYITGDYFLMMGSDDALHTGLFAQIANAMGDNSPDCIAFQTEIIEDGENLGVESITQFTEYLVKTDTNLAEFSRAYPKEAEIFFTRDTSKCYRRSLLGDLRYFGRYGFDADGIFSMLVCHNASSFQILPVVGYYWTKRKDSLSGRRSFFAQDCDRVAGWTRFYQILLDKKDPLAQTEKQYLYYFLNLVQDICRQDNGAQYSLIREALDVIQNVSCKEGNSLDLSKKDLLLMRSPKLWKMLDRFLP